MTPTETMKEKPSSARARRAPRKTAVAKPKAAPGKELAAKQGPVAELSDAWILALRGRQESALGTARKFVDVVDKVFPVQGGDESRRRKLIDGAFEFADWAAETQLDVMRSAMQSAVMVYVDVNVNVDTDVEAFANNDTNVDVTVPTDVGAFNVKTGGRR